MTKIKSILRILSIFAVSAMTQKPFVAASPSPRRHVSRGSQESNSLRSDLPDSDAPAHYTTVRLLKDKGDDDDKGGSKKPKPSGKAKPSPSKREGSSPEEKEKRTPPSPSSSKSKASPTRPPIPSPTRPPEPEPTRSPIPEPTRSPIPAPTRSPIPEPTRSPTLAPKSSSKKSAPNTATGRNKSTPEDPNKQKTAAAPNNPSKSTPTNQSSAPPKNPSKSASTNKSSAPPKNLSKSSPTNKSSAPPKNPSTSAPTNKAPSVPPEEIGNEEEVDEKDAPLEAASLEQTEVPTYGTTEDLAESKDNGDDASSSTEAPEDNGGESESTDAPTDGVTEALVSNEDASVSSGSNGNNDGSDGTEAPTDEITQAGSSVEDASNGNGNNNDDGDDSTEAPIDGLAEALIENGDASNGGNGNNADDDADDSTEPPADGAMENGADDSEGGIAESLADSGDDETENDGENETTDAPTVSTTEPDEELDVVFVEETDEDDITDPPTFATTESEEDKLEVVFVGDGNDADGITEPPSVATTVSREENAASESNDIDGTVVTEPPTMVMITDNEKTNAPAKGLSNGVSSSAPDALDDAAVASPGFLFDTTKFVAVERLPTIAFRLTVDKFTPLKKKRKLKLYLQTFLEDVLDMGSNAVWYPSHVKSIGKITVELLPLWDREGTIANARNVNPVTSNKVVLLLDAFVFVHVNDDSEPSSGSKETDFRELFYHNLNLYSTFWGFEDLEAFLEDTSGLQSPVLESVRVGNDPLEAIESGGRVITNGIQESSAVVQGLQRTTHWVAIVILTSSILGVL